MEANALCLVLDGKAAFDASLPWRARAVIVRSIAVGAQETGALGGSKLTAHRPFCINLSVILSGSNQCCSYCCFVSVPSLVYACVCIVSQFLIASLDAII